MSRGFSYLALAAVLAGCSASPSKSAWLLESNGTPWVAPDGQCMAVRQPSTQDDSGFCYDVMTGRYRQRHHYEALDMNEFGFMYPQVDPTPAEAVTAATPAPSDLVAVREVEIAPVPTLEQIYTPLPFRFNNAHLSAANRRALRESFAGWRTEGNLVLSVLVTGHTDSTGPADYNLQLSRWRAQSVAYFLRHIGVPRDHIKLGGAGMLDPHPDAKTPADNRFVDLRVWLQPPEEGGDSDRVAVR